MRFLRVSRVSVFRFLCATLGVAIVWMLVSGVRHVVVEPAQLKAKAEAKVANAKAKIEKVEETAATMDWYQPSVIKPSLKGAERARELIEGGEHSSVQLIAQAKQEPQVLVDAIDVATEAEMEATAALDRLESVQIVRDEALRRHTGLKETVEEAAVLLDEVDARFEESLKLYPKRYGVALEAKRDFVRSVLDNLEGYLARTEPMLVPNDECSGDPRVAIAIVTDILAIGDTSLRSIEEINASLNRLAWESEQAHAMVAESEFALSVTNAKLEELRSTTGLPLEVAQKEFEIAQALVKRAQSAATEVRVGEEVVDLPDAYETARKATNLTVKVLELADNEISIAKNDPLTLASNRRSRH